MFYTRLKIILFLLPVFTMIHRTAAQTPEQLERTADAHYAAKEFSVSAGLYLKAAAVTGHMRPTYFYNAACSYALSGRQDSAFYCLNQALEAGWDDYALLFSDHDLDSLRKTDGWKALTGFYAKQKSLTRSSYFWGMFFGFLFILFFYNFFLFVSIRDRSYLWYSLSILMYANFEFVRTKGFALHIDTIFFWMKYAGFPNGVLILCIFMIFYLLFFRSFHNLGHTAPKANKVVNTLIVLFFVMIFVSLFSPTKSIVFLLILLAYLFAFGTGLYLWKNGYKPARFFAVASVMLIVAVHISVLADFGLVQNTYRLTVLGPDQVGSVVFYLLLSFALGDRVKILTKEKEDAQVRALETLEEKVKERTAEVIKQKEDIERQKQLIEEKQTEILDSIRYAKRIQTALLASEKYIHKNISRLTKKS